MYATVGELRGEGVTLEQADDNSVQAAIAWATAMIDELTGQWFEKRTRTIRVDGNGARTLFLRVPIIALSRVKLDGVEIPLADVVVYNQPEHRRNPRVYYAQTWRRGRQNVELSGDFGYVDLSAEGQPTVPPLINHACRLLALKRVAKLTDVDAQDASKRGRITLETTDSHQVMLAAEQRPMGLTGDPEVDSILVQFMAPLGIGSV